MTIYLKQSTASQEVPLGYFVDSADGNTEETTLTINNTDIKLWKTGATTLANKNSGGATHISNGIYYAVLDATDTDTLGPLVLFVHVTGALAMRLECVVLAANIYDSLIAGTDLFDVNVTQLVGVSQSASDLKDFADDGYDPATNKVQGVVLVDTLTTYTNNTPQTGDNFARLGAPAGASISADIAAIEAQTDDIGANGAGLTAVPWNAAWDVEVQSEVNDGLVAFFTSMATLITNIWGNATRTLTAGTNIVLAKGVGVTGFNDLSAAQVNAEVVDALNVDSYTEPGQTSPPVSASLAAKIGYLYKGFRNKFTQTATQYSLMADDGTTVDQKTAVSDDGTTFTRNELTSGP